MEKNGMEKEKDLIGLMEVHIMKLKLLMEKCILMKKI